MTRASDVFGPDFTQDQVCRGCMQRHNCARCLDDTPDEYIPPSALKVLAARSAKNDQRGGCTPLVDAKGRAFGFVCRRRA